MPPLQTCGMPVACQCFSSYTQLPWRQVAAATGIRNAGRFADAFFRIRNASWQQIAAATGLRKVGRLAEAFFLIRNAPWRQIAAATGLRKFGRSPWGTSRSLAHGLRRGLGFVIGIVPVYRPLFRVFVYIFPNSQIIGFVSHDVVKKKTSARSVSPFAG